MAFRVKPNGMSTSRLNLPILSDRALAQVEQTTFRLLAEIGINIGHHRGVELLIALGCQKDGARVRIPEAVVRHCLQQVNPRAEFHSRDGARTITLDGSEVRVHNGGGPPFVLDLNGQRRSATLKDVTQMSRLLDALPNIDVLVPLFGPQDVPPNVMTISAFAELLRNTTKPIGSATVEDADDVRYILELWRACPAGQRGLTMSFMVSPISPLRFPDNIVDAILAVAEAGMQLQILPCPTVGGTAPITMAGHIAQHHAEVLAGIVLAVAARPGLPVLSSCRATPLDLTTATVCWGSPDVGMAGACTAQLARRFGLACDSYGFAASAAGPDAHHGEEKLANALVAALGGVAILSGAGVLENALTGSYVAAVLDNETMARVRHIWRGYQVTDETLAFDVMNEVIRDDGNFLAAMHTAEHARDGSVWQPVASAKTGEAATVARRRAEEILANHRPAPLPAAIEKEFQQILAAARRELTV